MCYDMHASPSHLILTQQINAKGKESHHFTLDAKHLLMMTKDVNIRSKTTQFSEENRKKLHDTRLGNDLLNMTTKAQTRKEKIN